MIRALSSLLLITWPGMLMAQDFRPVPGIKRLADVQAGQNPVSAFSAEQRPSETPIRIELDCPPPELQDVIKTATWNTLEAGITLPLDMTQIKPYTRYTCPGPKTP